jgi:hypothetical protein
VCNVSYCNFVNFLLIVMPLLARVFRSAVTGDSKISDSTTTQNKQILNKPRHNSSSMTLQLECISRRTTTHRTLMKLVHIRQITEKTHEENTNTS